MHPLIADNLDQIRRLCEEFGVERLEVFGSINTSGFDHDRSDVDFLVTYPEGYVYGPWMGRLFDLEAALDALLDRKVDLIRSSVLQRDRFRGLADRTRQVVFTAPEIAALT